MNEMLRSAYKRVQQKDIQSTTETVGMLKALPRTEKGVFDLSGFGGDIYETASYAYPVYCAYETVCNKKEGYLDLMEQMRAWKKMTDDNYNLDNASGFLQVLMNTIEQMSPEIYEYYRELVDIFRGDIKRVLNTYYTSGCFSENGKVNAAAAERISGAVKRACDQNVLLAEKYQGL